MLKKLFPPPTERTDDELVAGYLAGDPRAFDSLYGRYAARVYTYLKREAGTAAEDLLQDTFVRLANGLPSYKPCGKFASFLFMVARNVLRNHWKRVEPGSADLDTAADVADPQRVEQLHQDRACVDEALGLLSPEQREVLLLHEVAGLSFEEIARLTRSPLGTVLSRMHRGLERIRRSLRPGNRRVAR